MFLRELASSKKSVKTSCDGLEVPKMIWKAKWSKSINEFKNFSNTKDNLTPKSKPWTKKSVNSTNFKIITLSLTFLKSDKVLDVITLLFTMVAKGPKSFQHKTLRHNKNKSLLKTPALKKLAVSS